MNDHPGASETVSKFPPFSYLMLAKGSIAPYIIEEAVFKQDALLSRIQTFAATCAVQAYTMRDVQNMSEKGKYPTLVEMIQEAMEKVDTRLFSEEKRRKIDAVLQQIAGIGNCDVEKLYDLLFGLSGDTAIGEFEEAIGAAITGDPDKRVTLATLVF